MSLYRQVGRRSGWLVVSATAALLVGLVLGFGVGRATTDEPTFEDAVADVQADAGRAADAIELVGIHYATTEAAAREQLERAEESFDEVRPQLQLLSPQETAAAAAAIQQLASLVGRSAPAAQVERAADEARAAVRRAARLR
jgi:hypothetical protein